MAEAAEGEDSIELCRRLRPDVLVLGVPDINAFQALERLDEASLRPRTIAVIGTDEGDPVYRSRVLGVEAVLEQSKLAQEIATTIELVHGGRFIYTEEHDRKTLKRLASAVHRARIKHRALSTLTPRELEILRFLAEGLSNRECANRLGISERTVESHIGKIYRKLETRSRMEAVTKAMALGLLGDEMS